ncbi:unnamed protein product [Coffea canephora]|uniref:Uncharacterized protein n=1 Tax=Coffea canephora TaxID=49390 RepID=A0A068V6N2_COFCA|nr:unnamed protein product [Coffea canephora]
MSHTIADANTSVTFINAWAASCRGDAEIPQCSFDSASLFPPRELAYCGWTPTTGKIATKRFVFDKEKLGILKPAAAAAAASPESQVNEPTRVEAVSAFFWKHFVELSKSKADSKSHKIVAAVHPVNLRPRMNPPLPDHAFGNLWIYAIAVTALTAEEDKGYSNLAGVLSNTLRNINSNHAKQLQSGDEYLCALKKVTELLSKGELEVCFFTSWCRFPVYEVDYGWGKPTWVCTTTFPFKNLVVLMTTSCGEGIEAWVNMLEEDVARFERDHMYPFFAAENFSS